MRSVGSLSAVSVAARRRMAAVTAGEDERRDGEMRTQKAHQKMMQGCDNVVEMRWSGSGSRR
jgi:hypothetical protein